MLSNEEKQRLIRLLPNMNVGDLVSIIQRGDITINELNNIDLNNLSESNKNICLEKINMAKNLINSMPNSEEQEDWAKIKESEDFSSIEKYINKWESRNTPQNHVKDAKDKLKDIPNPKEQEDWNSIQQMSNYRDQNLINRLNDYIRDWERLLPYGNHVNDARDLVAQVTCDIEEEDWRRVNHNDKISFLGHYRKYPTTAHFAEIDTDYWRYVEFYRSDLNRYRQELTKYCQDLGTNSMHYTEAQMILSGLNGWCPIRDNADIFELKKYIDNNPSSPFINDAYNLYNSKRDEELAKMKHNPSAYDVSRFKELVTKNVFTRNYLEREAVVSERIFERIMGSDWSNDHTALDRVIERLKSSEPICSPNATDVFLFGVPGTGKSCVLMGLTSSDTLNTNLATYGGDYVEILQDYTNEGRALPPTPGDFVATIKASIEVNNINHSINLVEMSGEEFLKKIAKNPDGTVCFNDMGSGTAQLLQNDNRKVFFIIIDPINPVILYNEEVNIYNENDEIVATELRTHRVNQYQILKRFVDMFALPVNENVMRKVDAIHIIMTKADMMGRDIFARENNAKKLIESSYKNSVRNLVWLSNEYGINETTNYTPRIFTFSLGSFYVGNIFDFDDQDANTLVEVIRKVTIGERPTTGLDRFKKLMNKPVI